MSEHDTLSPSARHRWAACPASVREEKSTLSSLLVLLLLTGLIPTPCLSGVLKTLSAPYVTHTKPSSKH